MADCEFASRCPFFNNQLAAMPVLAEWLKRIYCRNRYPECARYMVRQALGPDKVPKNLFPDDHQRADLLMRDGREGPIDPTNT